MLKEAQIVLKDLRQRDAFLLIIIIVIIVIVIIIVLCLTQVKVLVNDKTNCKSHSLQLGSYKPNKNKISKTTIRINKNT